jgi:hypothetical protein
MRNWVKAVGLVMMLGLVSTSLSPISLAKASSLQQEEPEKEELGQMLSRPSTGLFIGVPEKEDTGHKFSATVLGAIISPVYGCAIDPLIACMDKYLPLLGTVPGILPCLSSCEGTLGKAKEQVSTVPILSSTVGLLYQMVRLVDALVIVPQNVTSVLKKLLQEASVRPASLLPALEGMHPMMSNCFSCNPTVILSDCISYCGLLGEITSSPLEKAVIGVDQMCSGLGSLIEGMFPSPVVGTWGTEAPPTIYD